MNYNEELYEVGFYGNNHEVNFDREVENRTLDNKLSLNDNRNHKKPFSPTIEYIRNTTSNAKISSTSKVEYDEDGMII